MCVCVCVCVCVCLASGEHKAELLFIRLQKSGCVLCCSCRLYVCSSASLSLSLSFHPSLRQDDMEYISRSMCGSFPPLHTSSSPLPPGLTHKLLFFCTFPNIKTNTRPLIQSHVVSFSPPTAAHLADGTLNRELILDHLCHVFF